MKLELENREYLFLTSSLLFLFFLVRNEKERRKGKILVEIAPRQFLAVHDDDHVTNNVILLLLNVAVVSPLLDS